MTENSFFTNKIDQILSKGRGIKALLFDKESKQIISNLIPHSKFLENDFFLFELITNKNRKRMSKISCVVILRPENMTDLIDEIKNPYYDDYIVLFTNQITSQDLQKIAENDKYSVITEIFEIYLDFYRIDDLLFTILPIENKFIENKNKTNRICDGIFSLLYSLNCSPSIRVQKNIDNINILGCELSRRLTSANLDKKGELYIFDRSIDLITPLLYEWKYLPMIYEYLEYENGIATCADKKFSFLDDMFFEGTKFKDINGVSEELQKFIKTVENKTSSYGANRLENIEEKTKLSDLLEKHLIIHNYISKNCIENKDYSELEMKILKYNKISPMELAIYIKDKSIDVGRRLKLLLVFLLRNNYNFSKSPYKSSAFDETIMRIFPEFLGMLDRYYDLFHSTKSKSEFGISFLTDAGKNHIICNNESPKRIFPTFKDNIDLKIGYEPVIKKIVNKIFLQTLKEKHFPYIKKEDVCNSRIIILYFNKGFTFSEYVSIRESIKKNFSKREKNIPQVYILCDFMIGYKDIYKCVL